MKTKSRVYLHKTKIFSHPTPYTGKEIKWNGLDTSGASNVVYTNVHELPAPLVDELLYLIYFIRDGQDTSHQSDFDVQHGV